ncbi:hypothetical protein [Nonomuraea sp. NPDC049725]|uniref:hypothetical protein n=1 Tax=Nonomuraea sp. NPDC049725 TaxID=3154508 RepID=UPI00341855A8
MSLVAVVLLVLVVVALGMRSMNRRESSLPPERLKEMAEKEEKTHARSTDEFAAHEPRMSKFSPDFSPIDEPKPKPVRTGQRGKRGVDEWGNPHSDDEDEEFWANIRSDAEEGGFGAGGTVAARKGASRPVERERPAADRPAERPAAADRPTDRPADRPAAERPAGRPERPSRRAKREPVAADPNAATVQAPLPQRPAKAPAPAAAASGLADLVEPVQRPARSSADLADQRTMTFAAPTADVLSILGAGAQPVPPARPEPTGSYPGSGSFPAAGSPSSGSFPAAASPSSGSFPATSAASTGAFTAVPASPIHGAPTSDPFPAYNGGSAQGSTGPLDSPWPAPPGASPGISSPGTTSGSWAASPDILDDPGPASTPSGSWPAFEPQQPAYPASYEVRAGWAVADDSDALTGPSPVTGTPTAPARAVSAYDDVLSAPPPAQVPGQSYAYETGDFTSPAMTQPGQAAWPEPPAPAAGWPGYGAPEPGGRPAPRPRPTPEQEFPDYYR